MRRIGRCIESISMTNFQSHTETRLELAGEGCLTVIVGPTDSGKTSIVRALKWVMYNQPAGTGFVRAGATSSRVSIAFTSGAQVTRFRSASQNQYRLSRPGEGNARDESVFEGFGVSVPDEVQQVLQVYPISVGDLVLLVNLAEQLDGPFLGRGVPSTLRAKALLRLAGSEVLDVASNRLGTDIHRASREAERLERECESVERELERHSWVIPMSERIRSVDRLMTSIGEKAETIERCRALSDELANLPARSTIVDRVDSIRSALLDAQTLDKQFSDWVERLERITRLNYATDRAAQSADSVVSTLRRLRGEMGGVQEAYGSLAARLEHCPTCGQRLPGGGLGSEQ